MHTVTYVQALVEGLREEMLRDSSVIVLGEDVGVRGGPFNVTKNLCNEFGPERVRDTPISESAFVGCATGAALAGMRPVVDLMYIDFSFVAMDQLCNQMAKLTYMLDGAKSVPVTIRTQGGSGRGNAAQHSQSLESLFCHIPGIKVVCASTPYDAKGLYKSAIRENNPVMFIDHKALYNVKGEIPEEEYTIPLGKAAVRREGTDVTLVGYSFVMREVEKAAEILEQRGVSAEVIDLRTLVPLDYDTLAASLRKTHRMVLVSEAPRRGNYICDIASRLTENEFFELDAPILCVAGPDCPVPSSRSLEQLMRPDAARIADAAVRYL